MSIFATVLAAVIVTLVIYSIWSFNRLVSLRHNLKVAWGHIDVMLKQRHDELPKLVSICREYMQHEHGTLEKVELARSRIAKAMQDGDLVELGVAEGVMSKSLEHLFSVTRSYPDLKTNETFLPLQSRLYAFENTIADRRAFYNASVRRNNTAVNAFPASLIASWFAFKNAPLLQVAASELDDARLQQFA